MVSASSVVRFRYFFTHLRAVNGAAVLHVDLVVAADPRPPCISIIGSPNIEGGFCELHGIISKYCQPIVSAVLTLRSH